MPIKIMDYYKISSELKKVFEEAIEIALDTVSTENSELHSFVIYGKNSDKLERFACDSGDEALDAAIEFIEEIDDGSENVVYAFKETIELNDGEFDTIVVHVYGIDEDTGYSFWQLYRVNDHKIQLMNEKVFLGKIRNVLVF